MTATDKAVQLANLAGQAAADKLGDDIVALDVTDPMPLTDIFLIVSARNERQVVAISDAIEDRLLLNGHKLLRREGKNTGRWVLLDFGDIVCHVFHEEDRMFYSIERLWKDCPVVKLELETGTLL
jgi:ribosome-associated protein